MMNRKGYLFISNSTKPTPEKAESLDPVSPNSFSKAAIWAANKMGWELHMGINRSHPEQIKSIGYDIKFYDQHTYRNILAIRDNLTAYRNLCKYLRDNPQIEIIHCNTPIGGVVGRLAGKKFKKKVIYTAHGFHFYKGAPLLNRTVLKWIENFLARYTDLLITINHEDFEAAKKFKLKKGGQVVFVPGVGIDLSLFDNPKDNIRISKRNELGLSETDIVMISMGDLVPRKNYGLAINALAGANVSNLHYLICGEGSEKDNLLSQSEKLGVKDRTHFLGYRTDIRELLYSSDIFIFPTLQEGLPRSAMEAMAAGLPCLMSDIRGNNDLIKDGCGGFLCKTDDLDIWSEKLRLLAEDRILRHKMGACNLARIIDFDISKVQNVMADVFSEDLLSVAKQDLGSSTITIGGGKQLKINKLINTTHSEKLILLLAVGDLNDNKNISTLILALTKCPNNCHILFCGDGPLRNELHKYAEELGVDRRCHFLGFRRDIMDIYRISDIFVMASKREGLPRSTMEAMAAGLPCVVSDIRGNRDLIDDGKGGYLVSPTDANGFATRITELINNPASKLSMSQYNRSRVKEFDISI